MFVTKINMIGLVVMEDLEDSHTNRKKTEDCTLLIIMILNLCFDISVGLKSHMCILRYKPQ